MEGKRVNCRKIIIFVEGHSWCTKNCSVHAAPPASPWRAFTIRPGFRQSAKGIAYCLGERRFAGDFGELRPKPILQSVKDRLCLFLPQRLAFSGILSARLCVRASSTNAHPVFINVHFGVPAPSRRRTKRRKRNVDFVSCRFGRG